MDALVLTVTWYTQLRVLGFLRRAVVALERSASAHEALATEARNRIRTPRKVTTSFESLDVEEANKAWKKEREAELAGQQE